MSTERAEGALPSASDDEVGGFLPRLREQLRKGVGNKIGT
jgi:hypothetical protein